MAIKVEIKDSESEIVRGFIVGYVYGGDTPYKRYNGACAVVQVPGHERLYVRSLLDEVKVVDTKHKTMMEVVTQED